MCVCVIYHYIIMWLIVIITIVENSIPASIDRTVKACKMLCQKNDAYYMAPEPKPPSIWAIFAAACGPPSIPKWGRIPPIWIYMAILIGDTSKSGVVVQMTSLHMDF